MTLPPRRTPLGVSRHAFGLSYEVFLADEWIEVDEVDGSDIRRMRVPYDEVLMVARHDERPWWMLLPILFLTGPWFVVSLVLVGLGLFADDGETAQVVGGLVLLVVTGLLNALLLGPLVRGVKVMSVFGERSKAQVRFTWRHAKADEAHSQVMARVRRVRRALEAKAQAERDRTLDVLPDALQPPPEGA